MPVRKWPLFDRPARQVKDAAFTTVARNGGKNIGRTVRTDRWRYTEWDEGRSGVELYDHRVDPGEYYNVAAQPALSGEIAKLKRMLASGRRKSRQGVSKTEGRAFEERNAPKVAERRHCSDRVSTRCNL